MGINLTMKRFIAKGNAERTIVPPLNSGLQAGIDHLSSIVQAILTILFIKAEKFVIDFITNISSIRLSDRKTSAARFHVRHLNVFAIDRSENIATNVPYSGITKPIVLIKLKKTEVTQTDRHPGIIAIKKHSEFFLPERNAFSIHKIRCIIFDLRLTFMRVTLQILSFFTFLFTFLKVLLIEPGKEVYILKSKTLTLLTFLINTHSLRRVLNQAKGNYWCFIKRGNCKFIGRVIGIRVFFSFFYKMKKPVKHAVHKGREICMKLVLPIQEKELISGLL